MNSGAKRMMAIFAVLAMIATAPMMFLMDQEDSSATDPDCTTYYYDQLDTDFAKSAYTAIASLTDFSSPIVHLTAADKTAMDSDSDYLISELSKAVTAAGYDNPLVDYYFRQYGYSQLGDDVTINLTKYDAESEDKTYTETKSTYDDAMATAITAIDASIDKTSTFTKIKSIHDYVADNLSYDKTNMNSTDKNISGRIRSVYTSLCGDHKVVCEGYAKMFKVLCDRYDIPCIIVTGMAGTDSKEAHMWNYVYYSDSWFLIDCTWDDQQDNGQGIKDTYLLAGTGKTGFNGSKVGNSHSAVGIDTTYYSFKDVFTFPVLSSLSVNLSTGTVDGVQYLVTFKVKGSTYENQYVVENGTVILPVNPTFGVGEYFLGWKLEGDTEFYDFSTPVTAAITLVAETTTEPVWALRYDTQGGSSIADTIVLQSDNTCKVTNAVPVKEGMTFLGWNTSATGKGIAFAAGDDITLEGNYTLYAIWEDPNAISTKVNSAVDKINEFFSKETIDGVSNILLTIGVITGAVSLLAIIAIARK